MSETIFNWINGQNVPAQSGRTLAKLSPVTGQHLFDAARSDGQDVDAAVNAARTAQPAWAAMTPVARGDILHGVVMRLKERTDDMATMVARETGKSFNEATGETGGAAALGRYYAGEGQRLHGRTMPSGVPGRVCMIERRPVGVAGLIIAANTPIANVAWKVFPALICGNAAVLKAAEDTPGTAQLFAEIAREGGLPDGVLNVIQGYGHEAGAALVDHPDVDLVSFTGSTRVGRLIAEQAGKRLAKVSLELGGKNPLVVCDDADLDHAVHWTALSAFSNAGQRCAAAGRVIVFDAVYDRFKEKLLETTAALSVGPENSDDLGPVINQRQLDNMLAMVNQARADGASILIGGSRLEGGDLGAGFYMAPTVIEDVPPDHPISVTELFGPITCLYRARDFDHAMELANDSPYGLTACIHTRDVNRAHTFGRNIRAGMCVVNGGTYGSEPHMPFGGVGDSGNGTREPGLEALDFYCDLKNIVMNIDPDKV